MEANFGAWRKRLEVSKVEDIKQNGRYTLLEQNITSQPSPGHGPVQVIQVLAINSDLPVQTCTIPYRWRAATASQPVWPDCHQNLDWSHYPQPAAHLDQFDGNNPIELYKLFNLVTNIFIENGNASVFSPMIPVPGGCCQISESSARADMRPAPFGTSVEIPRQSQNMAKKDLLLCK
ncbi:hypothetical protein MAR_005796 [Mya arenaria]|uniref:Uncharacterized protein n=1 Tax=Mya arenaria TaxID=6604 RepID=A0ABY7F3R3_MYAAR|nr:hypothetical protein MAR_005796 [Mya arenaria]